MKTLEYLLKSLKIKELRGYQGKIIESITYDSRKCTDKSLFVAIKGTTFDANEFIPQAIANGAKAIIYEGEIEDILNESITLIKVPNSRIALAEISKAWFDNPTDNISLFGVTGTNGKTTCTFIIKSLLNICGLKTGVIGTTGNYISNIKIPSTHTTPESLELYGIIAKMRDEGANGIVMEASSHALHQNRVYGIEYDGTIFTNLTHEHLDYHKTMKDYAEAKKRLFTMLKPDGIAILNADDPYSEYFRKSIKSKKIFSVGRNIESDFLITEERVNLRGIEYSLIDKKNVFTNKPIQLRTNLIGRFNVDNTAQSFLLCLAMGFEKDKLVTGLQVADGATGRMQRVLLKNGTVGIVDYAHTPDALEKALKTCREILSSEKDDQNKLICVFGCGGDRDKSKRPLMGRIATELSEIAIITNDNPRTESPEAIFRDIIEGITKNNSGNYKLIPDRKEAIAYAVKISNENDIILIAGKGHENYQIIGTEKQSFNDMEILGEIEKDYAT